MGFASKILKKQKVALFGYLMLNIMIFTFCINALLTARTGGFNWWSIAVALVLYAVSIIVATSPIGEWAFRLQLGCYKIERADQLERLEPVFNEVYSKAKQLNPSLSDGIELLMNNDKDPNAFAVGRKTICITKGMYDKCTDQEIKGVLAHEFSHILNRDTDLALVATVGNIIVSAIAINLRLLFRALAKAGMIFKASGSKNGRFSDFNGFAGDAVVALLMLVWVKIGQFVVLSNCRREEFLADLFSYKLGYGAGLCSFLDNFSAGSNKGVFAAHSSHHPSTEERINRLKELGCPYKPQYVNIFGIPAEVDEQ